MAMNNATGPRRRKEPDPEQIRVRLEALLSHQEQLLADPAERRALRRVSVTPLPAALRLNRLVPQADSLRPVLARLGQPVPWCSDAFTLTQPELRLGHTLEYALGAFYLQAAATTLAVTALDPQPGERVLDLCAAPGGKATQLAAAMDHRGLLVVNEMQRRRFPSLIGQLERCGVRHEVVTKAPGPVLARWFHNWFDRVLLDAPCSGDGIVRKDQQMLEYWSPEDARRQAQTQVGLLRAAFHMLRPGGVLVYSTCSLSLEENEEVLLGLFSHFPGLAEMLPVKGCDGPPLPAAIASRYPAALARCARVWPHRYDTEGAFVACLRKTGPTEWPHPEGDAATWGEAGPPDGLATAMAPAPDRPRNSGPDSPEAERPPVPAAAGQAWMQERWGLDLPDLPGQTVVARGKYLCLEPADAEAMRRHLPYFVRGGMRIGRRHHNHWFLSHQSVVLWGRAMTAPRVELAWEEVRALFRGESIPLPGPAVPRQELLCTFGPWTVCRGQVELDGCTLTGMVPLSHRRPDLTRLG
jgi:NOL1/NOP2/sun family putative RNA methylase